MADKLDKVEQFLYNHAVDPLNSPYAPGAGTPPPELAGREAVLDAARVALNRRARGRASKSIILIGLRGVGKTVLLERIRSDAEDSGITAVAMESPESRSLPSSLVPALRQALFGLSRRSATKDLAARAMRGLASFVGAMKVKYDDIEISIDVAREPGVADIGDLELDLTDLLQLVGQTAQEARTAVVFFVDELQYVDEQELAALITALHRIAQRQLPVTMVGAGLPQLRGRMGRAKSYAERLFDIEEIGRLSSEDARAAIAKPAAVEGVRFRGNALDEIVRQTQGYPYFLQEWGKHVWEEAPRSPITLSDVRAASARTIDDLDRSFFRVRFDRLTRAELSYARAMAELGAGPYRSGEIAEVLGREVTAVAPVRNRLINKGMVWSPSHGVAAFTVPLFDEFMKRTMPELE